MYKSIGKWRLHAEILILQYHAEILILQYQMDFISKLIQL